MENANVVLGLMEAGMGHWVVCAFEAGRLSHLWPQIGLGYISLILLIISTQD